MRENRPLDIHRRLWGGMLALLATSASGGALELAGVTLTPHVRVESMRYRHPPEPAAGARVQLFLRNDAAPGTAPVHLDGRTRLLFEGKAPADLLAAGAWAWHNTPHATTEEALSLPPGALTVWTFNGRELPFGPGGAVRIELGPEQNPFLSELVELATPECWLSSVTFLGPEDSIQPDRIVVHVVNGSTASVELRSCRLWFPADPKAPGCLFPQPPLEGIEVFNGHSRIPPGEHGGFSVRTGFLPLTYTVVEVGMAPEGGTERSVWGHLRVKPERFDISGGWVGGSRNPLSNETFLKALKRLYVNTAHIAETRGYTDSELYARYPLKYFNPLVPFETYDTDNLLPRIHAVECLGEPQYGGGRPVPPQEVWERLHPYRVTRLPTTLTHSEERVWRDYAGLSDFPHYDAYRVSAPSPDAWRKYDRWGEARLGWGAPLETIGDMCRSLRELNRPMPCAIWSQGPHDGWEVYDGRERTSPTPEEIRAQAYHALSTRITSLYWFNLSLKSLVQWRDTLPELGRIGREIRLLEPFLFEGDAFRHTRILGPQGSPEWDLASVCGPRAALLFALDLAYTPDPDSKVFRFGPPRRADWTFPLPGYLQGITDVFRIEADGLRPVKWSQTGGAIEIEDEISLVGVYLATPQGELRSNLEAKRQELIAAEAALAFDPGTNDGDFAALAHLLGPTGQ